MSGAAPAASEPLGASVVAGVPVVSLRAPVDSGRGAAAV
jgi:hypothetical protein